LHAAVYVGDGAGVVRLLSSGFPSDALQLAGDGLLSALAQRVDGAPALARLLVPKLRERDWNGDEELVNHLEALLGTGPAIELEPITVRPEEVGDLLAGSWSQEGGLVNMITGEVWQRSFEFMDAEDEEKWEEAEDSGNWLWVPGEGSHESYRDMEMFIDTVSDPHRADMLAVAISGRGAFRRFKDTLLRWPEERDRWFGFSAERTRGRGRQWLAMKGYWVRAAEHNRDRGGSG
jgi:hypothetical protein